MSLRAVCITTEKGKKSLGRVLKHFREANGWSIDRLIAEIDDATGYSMSKSAISELERGNTDPKWNTLAIIAGTGYIKDPVTGNPLTTSDLFKIACEDFDVVKLVST